MCYVDMPSWLGEEKVATQIMGHHGFDWAKHVTAAALRELMALHPEWWGEDLEIIKAALLFDDGPLIKVQKTGMVDPVAEEKTAREDHTKNSVSSAGSSKASTKTPVVVNFTEDVY